MKLEMFVLVLVLSMAVFLASLMSYSGPAFALEGLLWIVFGGAIAAVVGLLGRSFLG